PASARLGRAPAPGLARRRGAAEGVLCDGAGVGARVDVAHAARDAAHEGAEEGALVGREHAEHLLLGVVHGAGPGAEPTAARGRRDDAAGPAVGGVLLPLDEPRGDEVVDEVRHDGAVDAVVLGERELRGVVALRDGDEHLVAPRAVRDVLQRVLDRGAVGAQEHAQVPAQVLQAAGELGRARRGGRRARAHRPSLPRECCCTIYLLPIRSVPQHILRSRGAMPDYGHDLRFGSFVTPSAAAPHQVVALAELSEEVGLDLVTFQDHPYQAAFLDTWTLLSWVAARTERIRLAGNVLNLPLRPPAVLARSVASLDRLSGGRVEPGLGAGGLWDPAGAMGGQRLTPGESVDALSEGIDVIRCLWVTSTRARLVAGGAHHHVDGAKRGPAPAHDVEIWVGALKPRMLRLVGAKADGWLPSLPYLQSFEALARGNATIDA